MATPNIVPRATGEGGLGTAAKGWGGAFVTNTTTSSATEGGKLVLAADDGAVMADNHRLGAIEFKGAEDTSSTLTNGARIQCIADATWSASENGASLQFYTTDGNASESVALTLDSDNLATFAGSVNIDSVSISAIQTSGESFVDNDTSLMTSASIDDRIAAAGGGISHDGSTANGVLTYKDADEATVEANLTFDGSTLSVEADANTTASAINIDANSLTTGTAINVDVDDALTATAAKSLMKIDYDKSGVTASGQTSTTTGLNIDLADAATNHASGAVTMIGIDVNIDAASNQGTITQKGIVIDGLGYPGMDASTTIGIEQIIRDGAKDLKFMSSADNADYFDMEVSTNGSTTLTTTDAGGSAAHFEVAADGNITLDAAADIVLETGTTSVNSTSIPLRKFAPTGDNTAGNYNGGDVVYFGGTTSMTTGAIYHYKSDGTWELADADAVATSDGMLAVALGAASDTNGMLLRGMVTIDHDPGAIGDVLFLSTTAGDCSATAPSGSADIVRVIGYQVNHASNGEIWFCPDGTYVELA